MKQEHREILLYVIIGVFACAFFFLLGGRPDSESGLLGLTQRDIMVKTPIDVIGSAASPAVLTNSFDGASSTIKTEFQKNLHLDVQFTPYDNAQFLVTRVEVSNDGGTTYFPISTKDVTNSSIDVYTSSTNGIPLQWFQGITTVASTTYSLSDDLDIIADYVRVSARCNTGTNCEAYIRTTVETN